MDQSALLSYFCRRKRREKKNRENEEASDGCKLAIPQAIYQNKLSLKLGMSVGVASVDVCNQFGLIGQRRGEFHILMISLLI